MLLIKV